MRELVGGSGRVIVDHGEMGNNEWELFEEVVNVVGRNASSA